METFELSNSAANQTLSDAIRRGLISPRVFIDPAFEPIKTPRADFNRKEIQLQATHLSYLWAVCYTMIGLYEITRKTAELEIQALKVNDFPEIDQVSFVINWGIRQNTMRTIWPDGVPYPSLEDEHVKATNELFLFVIRYLMYHEAAHLIYHYSSFQLVAKQSRREVLSDDEKRRMRNMEVQADEFAFDSVVLFPSEGPMQYMRALGAIIAQLSSLYLLSSANTKGGSHPDYDDRIKRALKKGTVDEEPYNTYIHLTLVIGIQVFLHLHDDKYLDEIRANGPYETFEQLEAELFNLLERVKNQ